jgi:hypothetical protein
MELSPVHSFTDKVVRSRGKKIIMAVPGMVSLRLQ